MGIKPNLTNKEKAQIDVLIRKNFSYRDKARIFRRRKGAVLTFVKHEKSAKQKMRPGAQPKISIPTALVLVRRARQGMMTVRMVLQKSGLNVPLRTVQCIIFEAEHFDFGPLAKRLKLNAQHSSVWRRRA